MHSLNWKRWKLKGKSAFTSAFASSLMCTDWQPILDNHLKMCEKLRNSDKVPGSGRQGKGRIIALSNLVLPTGCGKDAGGKDDRGAGENTGHPRGGVPETGTPTLLFEERLERGR